MEDSVGTSCSFRYPDTSLFSTYLTQMGLYRSCLVLSRLSHVRCVCSVLRSCVADVVRAYRGVIKEKEALEAGLAVLSHPRGPEEEKEEEEREEGEDGEGDVSLEVGEGEEGETKSETEESDKDTSLVVVEKKVLRFRIWVCS